MLKDCFFQGVRGGASGDDIRVSCVGRARTCTPSKGYTFGRMWHADLFNHLTQRSAIYLPVWMGAPDSFQAAGDARVMSAVSRGRFAKKACSALRRSCHGSRCPERRETSCAAWTGGEKRG